MIISCSNIKKSFNDKAVLGNISFHIEDHDKVALIGNNGAGKTTLFKILTKELTSDDGTIAYSKDCTLGYLKQHMELDSDHTVYEELLHVFDDVIALEEKLHVLEEEIAKTSSLELIHTYDDLRTQFENNKGYEYKSLVKGVLNGLGFVDSVYDKSTSILSGGQKNRVALGKLLLQEPTLLLLDEPTNHLDIEAIEWLEGFLKAYKGALIIISHDRYFLDRIVNKVIHIEFGKCFSYGGNYSDYLIKSEKEYEVAVKHFDKQQREITQQQAIITKLKQFNREKSLKRARSREKLLDKIEVMDTPMLDNKSMQLSLSPRLPSGQDVLAINDLSKSFDEQLLFEHIALDIKKEDKVALVGPNGVGKTTLFRMILNQAVPTSGDITLGSNVIVGYYDQEHMNLNANHSIMEEIQLTFPELKNSEIRNVLAAFLFTNEDVFKNIATLSGGERGRVALAKIMLSQANFLILDEPTNHLDILSKEILENAINSYEGTVLYVSHDRYFINQTATKVIHMTKDGMTEYLGDYDYYLEKKKEQPEAADGKTEDSTETATKNDWIKQKEYQTQIKKFQNEISKIEIKIETTEEKIVFIDNQLCLEEIYTDFTKSSQLLKEKEQLDELTKTLYEEWNVLSESLDEFSSGKLVAY